MFWLFVIDFRLYVTAILFSSDGFYPDPHRRQVWPQLFDRQVRQDERQREADQ